MVVELYLNAERGTRNAERETLNVKRCAILSKCGTPFLLNAERRIHQDLSGSAAQAIVQVVKANPKFGASTDRSVCFFCYF